MELLIFFLFLVILVCSIFVYFWKSYHKTWGMLSKLYPYRRLVKGKSGLIIHSAHIENGIMHSTDQVLLALSAKGIRFQFLTPWYPKIEISWKNISHAEIAKRSSPEITLYPNGFEGKITIWGKKGVMIYNKWQKISQDSYVK